MIGDYSQGLYEDANGIAESLLKDNPNDAEANNIKGGINFYRGNFQEAVEYFRKAHLSAPKSAIYASNYGNALIEIKAYSLALEQFKSIDNGKRDRSYGLGRAYFYVGDYNKSEELLASVPSNYYHGAARILEAELCRSPPRRAPPRLAPH